MKTIEWHAGKVKTLDQTKLPKEEVIINLNNYVEVAEAIRTMKIRGAPLLGVAAALALALTAYNSKANSRRELIGELETAAETIRGTRPTAINLFWALDRILNKARAFPGNVAKLAALVVDEAKRISDEDATTNHLIGMHGAKLVHDGDVILTHCNAGALATVEYGTALGIIRAACEQEKDVKVIASETRPLLQGARLTAYELERDGIPVTLITDGMVGYVMYNRMIDKVIVGADRIVRDAVINKIGTFTVAVLAREHKIPFYVAAPKSTFDLSLSSNQVVIEERKPEEVTHLGSQLLSTQGVSVLNPAFDVTPFEYVSAIICESGILYKEDFSRFMTN